MPRTSHLQLPPLDPGGDTLGECVSRHRKERGVTQVELADKVGIMRTIVSAIDKGQLRLTAEMAVRFAGALRLSTDDLLMPAEKRAKAASPSRKALRRFEQIETLPAHYHQAVLKSLDMMLTGLKAAS